MDSSEYSSPFHSSAFLFILQCFLASSALSPFSSYTLVSLVLSFPPHPLIPPHIYCLSPNFRTLVYARCFSSQLRIPVPCLPSLILFPCFFIHFPFSIESLLLFSSPLLHLPFTLFLFPIPSSPFHHSYSFFLFLIFPSPLPCLTSLPSLLYPP